MGTSPPQARQRFELRGVAKKSQPSMVVSGWFQRFRPWASEMIPEAHLVSFAPSRVNLPACDNCVPAWIRCWSMAGPSIGPYLRSEQTGGGDTHIYMRALREVVVPRAGGVAQDRGERDAQVYDAADAWTLRPAWSLLRTSASLSANPYGPNSTAESVQSGGIAVQLDERQESVRDLRQSVQQPERHQPARDGCAEALRFAGRVPRQAVHESVRSRFCLEPVWALRQSVFVGEHQQPVRGRQQISLRQSHQSRTAPGGRSRAVMIRRRLPSYTPSVPGYSPPSHTPPIPSYSRPSSSGYQAPSYGTRPTAADPWKVLGDPAGDDSGADDPWGESGE